MCEGVCLLLPDHFNFIVHNYCIVLFIFSKCLVCSKDIYTDMYRATLQANHLLSLVSQANFAANI